MVQLDMVRPWRLRSSSRLRNAALAASLTSAHGKVSDKLRSWRQPYQFRVQAAALKRLPSQTFSFSIRPAVETRAMLPGVFNHRAQTAVAAS